MTMTLTCLGRIEERVNKRFTGESHTTLMIQKYRPTHSTLMAPGICARPRFFAAVLTTSAALLPT